MYPQIAATAKQFCAMFNQSIHALNITISSLRSSLAINRAEKPQIVWKAYDQDVLASQTLKESLCHI